MIGLDDNRRRIEAERIAEREIRIVNENPLVIRPNGCAACHVLFMIANKMKISEQDAADMLSEVLLDNNQLNDQFIEMVENIHMKQRTMGLTFVLKNREAKDRRIESQFKNTLNELLGDTSYYGSEIVLRKLIMSQIALELAQNLGIDYHASTEELYYYMRKKDTETHTELMQIIKSIIDKTIKK
ncbi:MAG: hypothetical protein M3M89_03320 [Thermoproteota archaeon]|nr:hypothetical protein [Thermoproteota archaeon]